MRSDTNNGKHSKGHGGWARSLMILMVATMLVGTCTTASADDHNTRTIVGDYFNPVFGIELTDGNMLLDTQQERDERKALNQSILDDPGSGEVMSLYERFGGDVRFVPYFGETRIESGIFDRFYTKIFSNDGEFKLTLDDIKLFFEESAVSNNVVYEGRPNILADEEINGGYKDPRVFAYSAVSTTGGDASLGNLFLGVGKFITMLASFICSSEMYMTIDDVFQEASDAGLAYLMSEFSKLILPLLIAIFIIGLIRIAFRVARGASTAKELLTRLLSAAFALGLIGSFTVNPMGLSNALTACVSAVDSVFDEALMLSVDDEVIKGSSSESIREASIWRVSVFEPWCIGMFGDTYNHLYTNYAELDASKGQIAMPQSNDDTVNAWDDGGVRYNSTKITGDVSVPVGGGKVIKNWAALAYSCQSMYHINAVDTNVPSGNPTWPLAELTPYNKQMYVDNFRWLDAKLNISPEYRGPGDIRMNFSNSNNYKEWFVEQGFQSLLLSLLLVPMLVVGIRRMVVSVKLVGFGFSVVAHGLGSFVMPDRWNPFFDLKQLVNLLYSYLWWSIMIFSMVVLYGKMCGSGDHWQNIAYLAVSIYLMMVKPVRSTARVRRFANRIKRAGASMGGKIVDAVQSRTGGK